MNNIKKLKLIAVLILVLFLMSILISKISNAAIINLSESWNSGDVEGWVGYDVLNQSSRPLSNPGTYLRMTFGEQSMSFPSIYLMMADSGSSGGRFVGNYWTSGVSSISFKFYCETHVPSQARLYFYNVVSGNRWYVDLTDLQVGQWKNFDISLNYSAGWKLDNAPSQEQFKNDVKDGVGWVGIRIQRNNGVDIQNYGLDDFELKGYSIDMDSDGDGFNDYAEWIAGTNPNDPSSKFMADIGATIPIGSIMLRWPSKAGNTYQVWKSTNLLEASSGFKLYEALIVATPPVNVYMDTNAASRMSFYRIKIE